MIDNAQISMGYGARIAIEQTSGVNDNMFHSHYHEYFEIYYLDAGERFHLLNTDTYRTAPGDLMLFSPMTMHHSFGNKDVPFSRVVIYFTKDMVYSPSLLAKLESSSGLYHPDEHASHHIRRLVYLLLRDSTRSGENTQERMQALLNYFLFCLMDIKAAGPEVHQDRIQQVIRYFNGHYGEPLNLDDLASSFYISKYYLCREFREKTGSTIITYLNNLRVMNAQRLFLETDWNLTKVSEQCGFSSLTHFNRVYKSITGETPSAGRKRLRSSRDQNQK